MTTRERTAVGIDIGFGDVKVVTGNQSINFPAHTATVADASMLSPAVKRRLIPHGGQQYIVGDDAKLARNVREVDIDSARVETIDYKLLGLHALDQIQTKQATLVTGLPVKDFGRLRKRVKELVQGWSTSSHKIQIGAVVPQPLGTYCSLALSPGADKMDDRFRDAKAAIIDIGSGTTDLIEINDGELNPSTFTTDAFAVSVAFKLIRNQLLIKHNADFAISEIPALVAAGEFESKGRTVAIGAIIRDAKRHVVLNAISVARRLWGDLRTFRFVIFTGGGAAFLESEIRQHINEKQLLIPEDPSMANARGFYYLATQKVLA